MCNVMTIKQIKEMCRGGKYLCGTSFNAIEMTAA